MPIACPWYERCRQSQGIGISAATCVQETSCRLRACANKSAVASGSGERTRSTAGVVTSTGTCSRNWSCCSKRPQLLACAIAASKRSFVNGLPAREVGDGEVPGSQSHAVLARLFVVSLYKIDGWYLHFGV